VSFNTWLHAWIHHEVLHHIAVMKSVNGCRRILRTLYWDRDWRPNFLAYTLTWLLHYRLYSVEMFKNQLYVAGQSVLEGFHGVEFNNLKLKQDMHTATSADCESLPQSRAVYPVLSNDREMGGCTRAISGKMLSKHVPAATYMNATIEELFSMRSLPRCYKQGTRFEIGRFCTGVCEERTWAGVED
jgi:hypothetical protein